VGCHCPEPIQATDLRRAGVCLKCCLPIDSEALSSDETIRAFFERFAATFPGSPPESFQGFRRQCEERERAGRKDFGLAYLSRDNLAEACEEESDSAIYLFLDTLRHRREAGSDDDLDLVLTTVWHSFKAHEGARRLADKRRGSP
jgi:hypothetical protein